MDIKQIVDKEKTLNVASEVERSFIAYVGSPLHLC